MMSNTNQTSNETMEIKKPADAGHEESKESVVQTDPVTQLEADLKAAKAESAEWQDRFLRKAAEFENFRKRVDKEKGELNLRAQSAILMEILPVVDASERALNFFKEVPDNTETLRQYREGVELLYRQVLDVFNRTGVVSMESEGKIFDPNLHEALSRAETSSCDEGVIVQELRRGYMFKDKLLRPAQVIVSVSPKTGN
jgi:molecular chaperone GrpE